jgi:hypothetical protein
MPRDLFPSRYSAPLFRSEVFCHAGRRRGHAVRSMPVLNTIFFHQSYTMKKRIWPGWPVIFFLTFIVILIAGWLVYRYQLAQLSKP